MGNARLLGPHSNDLAKNVWLQVIVSPWKIDIKGKKNEVNKADKHMAENLQQIIDSRMAHTGRTYERATIPSTKK